VHSLKNTFVAVVLLGVSYFVYDGITKPEPLQNAEAGQGLNLEMPEGFEPLATMANQAKDKVAALVDPISNNFGNQLKSFAPKTDLANLSSIRLSSIHLNSVHPSLLLPPPATTISSKLFLTTLALNA